MESFELKASETEKEGKKTERLCIPNYVFHSIHSSVIKCLLNHLYACYDLSRTFFQLLAGQVRKHRRGTRRKQVESILK